MQGGTVYSVPLWGLKETDKKRQHGILTRNDLKKMESARIHHLHANKRSPLSAHMLDKSQSGRKDMVGQSWSSVQDLLPPRFQLSKKKRDEKDGHICAVGLQKRRGLESHKIEIKNSWYTAEKAQASPLCAESWKTEISRRRNMNPRLQPENTTAGSI